MCNYCEACLGNKQSNNNKHNICNKCLNEFKREYKEYLNVVSHSLSFEDYLKMAIKSKLVKIA